MFCECHLIAKFPARRESSAEKECTADVSFFLLPSTSTSTSVQTISEVENKPVHGSDGANVLKRAVPSGIIL